MVVNKRKKVVKYRGGSSHGGGARKKRRGAGSRGGRGNAGTGKRAGQKKAGMKDRKLGHKGFTSKTLSTKAIGLNLFTLKNLEKFVSKGLVIKENDIYVIDLAKLGYQKLLGTGIVNLKLKIVVDAFSPKAEEKIKAAGGELISGNSGVSENSE
ncbi:50S ribosomal protein L15 [Candidatus Woesearchaeota archaeon CG_4_10_14_0_2_um_filter_33_13]|nr:MAG: 50S ribosomal protein L15 [Candidatus Woesearchaeota archaeon CG_4_10_14_0_2_um_filter_33_13]